jgi:hypothetical protein
VTREMTGEVTGIMTSLLCTDNPHYLILDLRAEAFATPFEEKGSEYPYAQLDHAAVAEVDW